MGKGEERPSPDLCNKALLLNKFRKRPPTLEGHIKLEKLASKFAHLLVFASLLTIPITGHIFTTFIGQNVSIFNTEPPRFYRRLFSSSQATLSSAFRFA